MFKKSRSHVRKTIAKFGFIQISGDEGGQILNISEAGLCFATFAPLGQVQNVQFWFSLDLRDRIEATGEVAWLDAETKVGGLRFVNVTERTLRHIRAHSVASPNKEGQLFASALAKADSERAAVKSDAPRSDLSVAFGANSDDASAFQPLDQSVDQNPPVPPLVEFTDLISLQRHLAVCRRQLNLGILIGILLSAAVAIPLAGYFGYRNRAESSRSPVAPAVTTPAKVEGPSPLNISAPTNAPRATATQPSYPSTPPRNISPVSSSPFSQANRGLDAASGAAQPRQGDLATAKKSGATPQQLWSAVQAGDTNAAVLLADRYLRGDGVPMNCIQARVLLLAASERNNAAAIKKLHELDKN